jgi:predicted nucleotidyltransferase|tara:strand:- start:492 stop:1253 length:762 start_codon:yes stop_codon:yes gene_type:complete
MKYKEVCDKIKGVLEKEQKILAIFNNGSSVVGMDTLSSDLDFVIILKNGKDKKKIIQILRKTFRVFKNEENPEINVEEQFDVLNRRADFTFISKKRMEEKVNNFYKSKENFLELQHFMKHKIVDSVSVYDPNKLLVKWKKKVEKYSKRIMKEVFNSQIYSIKEELFYWKNHCFRNEFQFGFEQWDIIKPICQAIYAKNNRMFMLPYKRIHNDLKELKPNIEKEMYELIRGKNTSRMINKKIKLVHKIIAKLEK